MSETNETTSEQTPEQQVTTALEKRAEVLKNALAPTFKFTIGKQDVVDMLVVDIEQKLDKQISELENEISQLYLSEDKNKLKLQKLLRERLFVKEEDLIKKFIEVTHHRMTFSIERTHDSYRNSTPEIWLKANGGDRWNDQAALTLTGKVKFSDLNEKEKELVELIWLKADKLKKDVEQLKFNLRNVAKMGQRTRAKIVKEFLSGAENGENILNKLKEYVNDDTVHLLSNWESVRKRR